MWEKTLLVRSSPLSVTVFALLATVTLLLALALSLLGSFSSLGVASAGMFFVAAALVARAAESARVRVASVLALASLALLVSGLTATPLFYVGWGLLAGALAIAVIGGRRMKA